MDADQLESELVHDLASSDLSRLASDLAELSLDNLLDDGIIKDLPVIGTVQTLYNVGENLRNRLFMKKLIGFLVGLADVPIEQRKRQINKLSEDAKEQQRLGENLLLLLDRMNNMSKPKMMARAFRAYLMEEICVTSLRKLWNAIDVLDVAYVPELEQVYSGQAAAQQDESEVLPPTVDYHHLAICGLLAFSFGGMSGPPKDAEVRRNPDGSSTKTVATFEQGDSKKNSLGALFVSTLL